MEKLKFYDKPFDFLVFVQQTLFSTNLPTILLSGIIKNLLLKHSRAILGYLAAADRREAPRQGLLFFVSEC